jgi:hypothetical protein
MADLEGFHNINFFIKFPNWLLGFLSIDFSGFGIIVLVIVLWMYQNGGLTNSETMMIK